MTLYELLLFVHALAVITWVGGSIALEVFGVRAKRSADSAHVTVFAGQAEHLSRVVLPAAATVVLITGLAMVGEGDWSMGEPFISTGLTVFLISTLLGIFFFAPKTTALRELVAAEGFDSPAVRERLAKIQMVARIDLLLLIVVVFMMATKLGT